MPSVKSFETVTIIITNYYNFKLLFFEAFRISDLFGKAFLITFKLSQLDFSIMFRKKNIKKTV